MKITETQNNKVHEDRRFLTICLLVATALLSFYNLAYGQVTIGSTDKPDKAKLLHLENTGGLGLPRVQLVDPATLEPFIDSGILTETLKREHTGLMVYNLATIGSFEKGVYVWDGNTWIRAGENTESSSKRWFYMPPFNLPMKQTGNTTFDLYAEYRRQFMQSLNNEYRTSSSNVISIPSPELGTLYGERELDYVVVHYDNTVITVNNISEDGMMFYNVLDTDPGALSYMTIIFIIRE